MGSHTLSRLTARDSPAKVKTSPDLLRTRHGSGNMLRCTCFTNPNPPKKILAFYDRWRDNLNIWNILHKASPVGCKARIQMQVPYLCTMHMALQTGWLVPAHSVGPEPWHVPLPLSKSDSRQFRPFKTLPTSKACCSSISNMKPFSMAQARWPLLTSEQTRSSTFSHHIVRNVFL